MLCNIHHRLNMLKVPLWVPTRVPIRRGLALGTLQRTSTPHARPQLSFLSTSCTLRIWNMPETVYSWPRPIPHLLQHDLQHLCLAVKPMLHASLAGLKILLLEQVNIKCCTIRYLSSAEAERACHYRDPYSDEYPQAP